MYFKLRLKSLLRSRELIVLLFLSIGLGLCCYYFANVKKSVKESYDIAIVDQDNTEASKKLINDISNMSGIRVTLSNAESFGENLISSGKYYLVYTIKKGYESKLQAGKIEDMIDLQTFSNNTAVKWINDKVAAIIIKEYVFYDMYTRIREYDEISLQDYIDSANTTKAENEILFLNVIENSKTVDLNNLEELTVVKINKYSVFLFLTGIGMYFSLKAVARLCKMRVSGLTDRLVLAKIGKKKMFFSEFLIGLVKQIFFSFLLFAMVRKLEFNIYSVSFLFMIISFCFFTIIERYSKDTVVYYILSCFIFVIMLVLAIGVLYLRL